MLNLTLAGLRSGREAPLADALSFVEADAPAELLTALRPIVDGTRPDALQSSGYVVHTLQAALYHGLTADTAEGAVVSAVAMGEDTDTVDAITGARFGANALPERWLTEIPSREELETLGSALATTTSEAAFEADDSSTR